MNRDRLKLLRRARLLTILLVAAIAVAGCTFPPHTTTATNTPVAPALPAARTETAPPAPAPTATAFPATPTPSPLMTATPSPTPAVVAAAKPSAAPSGPVCAADLALHPPVFSDTTSGSEMELQAAAMIPTAMSDLGALGQLTRYDISVTIDMTGPALYGKQTGILTNTGEVPLNELYFGLYPNAPFNFARLEVGDVMVAGQPVTTALEEEDTALRVSLPAPLSAHASLSVQMVFTTTVPTAPEGYETIAYDGDMMPLASWYPILLVHDASGWHKQLGPEYGDLVYSQSAFYDVDITSPAGLVVVASGIPYGQPAVSGASKTETFRTGPVRDFYVIASSAFCVVSRQVGDTTINSYFLAGREAYGEAVADIAAETVAMLDERAGTYPFREFDVAESPVRAGGVEYPGLVVISQRYYRAPEQDPQFVVAHETGHQWWYSLVGDDQVTEPWLDEALADYSAVLYWEQQHGSESAQALMRSVLEQPYQAAVRAGDDMPVDLPAADYRNESLYSAIVYDKGALYFASLRQAIGDDAFFRLLSEYFKTYEYRIAHSTDWRRLAQQIGGPAADKLYETWILGPPQ